MGVLITVFLFISVLSYADDQHINAAPGGIGAEIFGTRAGGYINPYLSLTSLYSDNINNTKNKDSDWAMIISPGICLAVPGVKKLPKGIETSNTTPGGIGLTQFHFESLGRYKAYLLYNPEFERYSDFDENDTTSHLLEGVFQYNFPGGLSINFQEQFIDTHDARGTGISSELDEYHTNLFEAAARYDTSGKFVFRLDCSFFNVSYDDDRNRARDRNDTGLSAYVFYKFKPKTSAFFEYRYIEIEYDEELISSSEEHHYLLGLKWAMTEKSKGSVKAGYNSKGFEISAVDDGKDFIFELQASHTFTPKRSMDVTYMIRSNETDIVSTEYVLTNRLSVSYLQRFTEKIMTNLTVSYTGDGYEGDLAYAGEIDEMDNTVYSVVPALRYEFKKWLMADVVYIYTTRDSSFSDFDYSTNTIFFKITGSL